MRRSVDLVTVQRITRLAGTLHDEAEACAKAGAFRPACVMLGAALEGALLGTVLVFEPQLRAADQWPNGQPLKWQLETLLRIALQAGWLPETTPEVAGREIDLLTAGLGDAARWLQWLRNVVHPGAFVRDFPPELDLGEVAYHNAYQVLDATFWTMSNLMDSLAEEL